jgi:alpha-ribazole phosphatase/probable phosphoglycerate mutase
MNTVLFIRHAETDKSGTFCGHSDPPVNQRGSEQIQELSNALSPEEIDIVYTSDLQRAASTAGALAERFGVSQIATPNLREIDFGDWEGLAWQEIEIIDPAYAHRWTEAYPNLPAPAGESFTVFQARVVAIVTEILNHVDHSKKVVVTHGGVMRVVLQMFCGVSGTEAWELTKPYCSFFRYPYRVAP